MSGRRCACLLVLLGGAACSTPGVAPRAGVPNSGADAPPPAPPERSRNELQLQHGELDTPGFAGGGSAHTTIVTLSHASRWSHGTNFFFVDFLDGENPAYNQRDVYAEWYPTLSLEAVTGRTLDAGPIRDLALIGGFNYAADADVVKLLPGLRLALDLPGFAFANLDLMAYLDRSGGLSGGGAPAQEDSWMVDLNGAGSFDVGEHSFSVVGHVEYIDGRRDELGNQVEDWILLQPELRYDLGKTLWNRPGEVHVGLELRQWWNKLGDAEVDQSAVLLLFVWRF